VRSLEGFGEESDRTFGEKILKFPQSGKRAKTEGGLGRREVFARKEKKARIEKTGSMSMFKHIGNTSKGGKPYERTLRYSHEHIWKYSSRSN
jgi:hypothetical protein